MGDRYCPVYSVNVGAAVDTVVAPVHGAGFVEAWVTAMLLIGLLGSLGLVPWVRRFAHRWGWMDPVDSARKIHRRPKPRAGGLCLFLPFLFGVLLVTVFLTSDLRAAALLKEWGWMIGGCAGMFAQIGRAHV